MRGQPSTWLEGASLVMGRSLWEQGSLLPPGKIVAESVVW